MVSRSSKGSGAKKLFTYGASRGRPSPSVSGTTRDHGAPKPCPSSPKRPQSRNTCFSSTESLTTSPSASAARFSAERREPVVDQHTHKRRKTADSATAVAGRGPSPRRESNDATDAGQLQLSAPTQRSTVPRAGVETLQREASSNSEPGMGCENDFDAASEGGGAATPARHSKTLTSRRRRLIDALAAQTDTNSGQSLKRTRDEALDASDDEASGSPVAQRTSAAQELRPRAGGHRRGTPTNRKIKLTYSQSKSSLSEPRALGDSSPLGAEAMNDMVLSEVQALSSPVKATAIYDEIEDDDGDDDDDDAIPQPAIKSVHELRRSGLNNRFADEMDDLLSRIGKPGAASLLTMRRNALCELAQRLPQQDFAEQFRDHSCRDRVAKGIGEEEDVVSGFALAAGLVIFLDSGPAPHLVRQLCQGGLGKLLGRLLRVKADMDVVAARKRTNLSRASAASVHGVKAILTQMPIWHELEPRRLSPRSLSLRLLETVSRYSEEQLLPQVAADLGRDLAAVAAEVKASDELDYPLTVFALEVLSSAGIAMGSSGHDARSICAFLARTMRDWPSEPHRLRSAVLKLAINTTNTERGAAAFDKPDLLSLLADRIGRGFRAVQDAIGRGSLEHDTYDALLLTLGVAINIVEHSPRARTGVDGKALDALAALWQENRSAMSEADSEDQSKVGVAAGYLAVLLGYLCLSTPGRERIRARIGSGEGVRALVASIRDFVDMYKAVDSKASELEHLVSELRRHHS